MLNSAATGRGLVGHVTLGGVVVRMLNDLDRTTATDERSLSRVGAWPGSRDAHILFSDPCLSNRKARNFKFGIIC